MKRNNFRQQALWAAATTVIVLLLLFCIFMVTSCSGDDEPDYLPPYQKTLCELLTDSTGHGTTVRFDDGHLAPLKTPVKDLRPDTLYRIGATTLEYADGLELYNAAAVFAPMPANIKAGEIKTDPVEVLTAWRETRYINLRLSVRRGSEADHYMAFVDQPVKHNLNGTHTKIITFYHDRNGDGQHYRQETIVSCPVYHLGNVLRQGIDSVSMIVHTPTGPRTFTTVY